MQKFKNLIQLMDYFKEEKTCEIWLAQDRWGDTPSCPHCGNVGAYVTNRGYKCKAKECHKKFTVTTGTVMESTKIALRLWIAAIYLATSRKKGISSMQLSRDLGITQKTAWFLLHRIRFMLANNAPELLDGVVEIDETYVGGDLKNKHAKKQKNLLGRGIEKTPVVAMVQRNGSVIARVMPSVGGFGIWSLIKENLAPGSTMITDGFSSYNWIGRQYNHIVVKHNKNYITYGDKHTNNVEGFFSHFKRMLVGTYHYVSPKHLQQYCDEIAYRFSSRKITDVERFNNCFKNMNTRLTYAQLIAK